jgi:alpha-glucosidase
MSLVESWPHMSEPSLGLSGAAPISSGRTTKSSLARKAASLGLASLLLAGAIPALTFTAAANAAPGDPAAIKAVTPEVPVDAAGVPLGAVTGFTQSGNVVELSTDKGAIRVTFLDDGNFRLEADPSGKFTDPANTDQGDPARTANIVVGKDKFPGVTPTVTDGDWLVLKTAKISVGINKATTQLRVVRADGSLVLEESAPITFGANSATQHLAQQDGEQFIGGGMQNGRSVHTGALINIAKNFDWDDDGYPNAVPYYMSSKGYGVLRDTFARGSYNFAGQATTTHEEKRFDAYYFVGDYKQSLGAYTTLTGKPMMPPVYALEYGDADCYNRSNPGYSSSGYGDPDGAKQRTPDAIKTARKFVENDMPAGWMLVNDGYGCEYQQLPETVGNIEDETDLKVGLWRAGPARSAAACNGRAIIQETSTPSAGRSRPSPAPATQVWRSPRAMLTASLAAPRSPTSVTSSGRPSLLPCTQCPAGLRRTSVPGSTAIRQRPSTVSTCSSASSSCPSSIRWHRNHPPAVSP